MAQPTDTPGTACCTKPCAATPCCLVDFLMCQRVRVKSNALPQRECRCTDFTSLSQCCYIVHALSTPGHKPHGLAIAGSTEEVSLSSSHNQLVPPKDSLPRQLSGRQALQQDASPSQLPGPISAKQATPQEPVSDTQQQPQKQQQQQQPQPEAVSVPKAAVHGRPERPTSARRGPPKIPQTGSAGKHEICHPRAP